MNKWGEIARYNHEGKLYILSTFKQENRYDKEKLYCTSFCFEISTKTAKKSRDKKLSKIDKKFSLLDDDSKNFSLIRKVIRSICEYLEKYPTDYIYLIYYGRYREEDKRFKLYSYVMSHLGYNILEHVKSKSWWEQGYSYYVKK